MSLLQGASRCAGGPSRARLRDGSGGMKAWLAGDAFERGRMPGRAGARQCLSALLPSTRVLVCSCIEQRTADGEVEERRLHLSAGYGSMFAYCTSRLLLSEDEAYRRIEVARLARRFPVLFSLLANGRISLSVAGLLRPHLTAQNADELIQLVSGTSVQRARVLLAARFPRPDVPATIRKLQGPRPPRHEPRCLPGLLPPTPKPAEAAGDIAPVRDAPPDTSAPSTAPRISEPRPPAAHTGVRRSSPGARPVEPLAPGRYKIQLTADAELKNKLDLARDLMRHSLPSGDLSSIMARALDLLIEQLMKRRFGTKKKRPPRAITRAPAPSSPPASDATSGPTSSVSRSIRREVLERDGLRCSFRSEDGVQCETRAWLEDDHIHPRARGGRGDASNIRFLCRAHKQWAAERTYGRAHVEHAIERTRAKRTPAATGPCRTTNTSRMNPDATPPCNSTQTLDGKRQEPHMPMD